MTTALPRPAIAEEVTAADIAAVEVALGHIEARQYQKRQKELLGLVAQWFLVLKMFKPLEVWFAKNPNREEIEAKHRALLTCLMGMGEILLVDGGGIAEEEFQKSGYSRAALSCNVRYLREKYEQWFVDVPEEEIAEAKKLLMDEREVCH